jgi:uncharacterized protein
VITVRALHVFPVKSLRGIALARAEIGDRGFLHDRRFMVVDQEARFLTQRTLPRMALLAAVIDGERLRLEAPGVGAIDVPLIPGGGSPRTVVVWRDRCEALSLGEAPARWLTGYLGVRCELVYMPDETVRATDARFGEGRVGFADGFPFLVASLDSRAELARRGADVPIERFRANIVVEGAEPFAEDRWRRIRIGRVAFRVAKPCARCVVTTIDPALGKASGSEPLRTLSAFRDSDEGVLFGMNLIHEGRGTIAVGDEVEVTEAS